MQTRLRRGFFILWTAGLVLSGCTAGTAITREPRAAIDRPYTLPAGVDAWGTGANVSLARDNTSEGRVFFDIPLEWFVSLSDDWTLLLGSAFGVAHQFLNDGRQRIGARLSLVPGFGSSGVLLAPSLVVDDRVRLSRRWAWDSSLGFNTSRWTGAPSWSWGAGVTTGPILQLTDTVSLDASASLFFARSYLFLTGAPIAPSGQHEASVGLGSTWSLSRQWDVGASVGFERRANTNGYRAWWAGAGVANVW